MKRVNIRNNSFTFFVVFGFGDSSGIGSSFVRLLIRHDITTRSFESESTAPSKFVGLISC